jgi:hypothetical protein
MMGKLGMLGHLKGIAQKISLSIPEDVFEFKDLKVNPVEPRVADS